MNMSALPLHAQQGVILFSLAQQDGVVGEPVARVDAPFDVLDALVIEVDAALLDGAPRLALRLGEPGPDDCVYERAAVRAGDASGRDLLGQRVEHAPVRLVRI